VFIPAENTADSTVEKISLLKFTQDYVPKIHDQTSLMNSRNTTPISKYVMKINTKKPMPLI